MTDSLTSLPLSIYYFTNSQTSTAQTEYVELEQNLYRFYHHLFHSKFMLLDSAEHLTNIWSWKWGAFHSK